MTPKRAVVFAYHNVGVRCLKALLSKGIDVGLVITHQDNPNEAIWFDSVYQTACDYHIPVITPENPNTPEVIERIQTITPHFLFSFYYRYLLKEALLTLPTEGAFNMHGSLLPAFRGRVPVNWAIIHGASQTGATLHVMNAKPDNGPIVDQMAVPILPDDTALEVFNKVTVAAEMVMLNAIPSLIAGNASFQHQDLSQGGYYGGRKPEDGAIPPQASAQVIHNLVRALTKPFPGAFAKTNQGAIFIWKTLKAGHHTHSLTAARLMQNQQTLWLEAVDGQRLHILHATLDNKPLAALPPEGLLLQ